MNNKKNIDPEKNVLRPRIYNIEELLKLAEDLKQTPTAIVNFCVEVGIEVLTKSKDEIINNFKEALKNKLK